MITSIILLNLKHMKEAWSNHKGKIVVGAVVLFGIGFLLYNNSQKLTPSASTTPPIPTPPTLTPTT